MSRKDVEVLLMGMEIGIVNLESSMDIPETNKNKNWTTKSCHMINQFHFWIYIYIYISNRYSKSLEKLQHPFLIKKKTTPNKREIEGKFLNLL